MPREFWPHLLSPADAWTILRDAWTSPPPAIENVPLTAALGRILASDVAAQIDSPPFTRSAMDGYAIHAVDTVDASSTHPARLAFAGDVPMGRMASTPLQRGQAMWVATGSMLPPDADAVIMVERTHRDGQTVGIETAVQPGDSLVRQGDDVRAGVVMLRAGSRLRAQDIAVLASQGFPYAPVVTRPRVAILVSGDEIREPGTSLEPGQIYNSNGYALAAQVLEAGGDPAPEAPVPDQLDAVVQRLQTACASAPLVLLSGGSSVGQKDLTILALEQMSGSKVLVHGVATKPGKPSILALVETKTSPVQQQTVVIGIPGNPVSAMISFEMFGRRVIEDLLGLSAREKMLPRGRRATMRARLTEAISSATGRQDFARVALQPTTSSDEPRWQAIPVAGSSAIITSMVDADGIVIIPPEASQLDAGTIVDVQVF